MLSAQKFKNNKYLRRAYSLISRSLYFPPFVVLVAILVITIWPWQNARQSLQANVEQVIEEKAVNVQKKFTERFATYNTSLQSGAALLQANPGLTKEQWRAYFDSMENTTDRSGIQGTGYSAVFTANQTPQIITQMAAQGVSDFAVHPSGSGNELTSAVLYLYPQTDNNKSAIGFNMLSEPTRREAMLRARDTGKPTLTKKVTLVQDVRVGDGKGFLLYVPYFRSGAPHATLEQRRQSLAGFVYGGFRSKNVFSQLVEDTSSQQHYSLKIYDGEISDNSLFYQTENTQQLAKRANTTKIIKPLSMFGTTWQFEFTLDQSRLVSKSEQNAPTYILLVGVVTAFLVFLALLTIFKSRARELQQQKDKEVNLAKDELLSLASHQMRTPATGVKQYLGMVLQGFAGKVSSSQKELLDKAYTSNERQLHVINQILHLAKLETGRIVLAKHPADLNELVADVVDEQSGELQARKHTLKLKIPKRRIFANVDSHMIRMALENLLSNALKYTIEPGTITVKLSQVGREIRISIKDTGVGINEKDAPEIFKQFTRLYDEQTEKVSGTGVGLYLADQLVNLHDGSISVKSVLGKGSEFVVVLPRSMVKKQ